MYRFGGARTVATVRAKGLGKGGRSRTSRRPAAASRVSVPRPVDLSQNQKVALTEMAYFRAWKRYFALEEELFTHRSTPLKLLFVNEKLDLTRARLNLLGSMLDYRRRDVMDLAAKLTRYEQLVNNMYRLLKQGTSNKQQQQLQIIMNSLRSPHLIDDLTEERRSIMMQKAHNKYNPRKKFENTGQYRDLKHIPQSLVDNKTLQSIIRRHSSSIPARFR